MKNPTSVIARVMRRLEHATPARPPQPMPGKKADYSLRANPDSYLDRATESKDILQAIDNSSSAVIGIAGVRGAGKSSLALKVLESYERRGNFTLLIHSPLGYEPIDFLLSIFQRICEATIARVEGILGERTSVEAMGVAESKRMRRLYWAVIIGGLFIFTCPVAYTLYESNKASEEGHRARLKAMAEGYQNRPKVFRAALEELEGGLAWRKATDGATKLSKRNSEAQRTPYKHSSLRDKFSQEIASNRYTAPDVDYCDMLLSHLEAKAWPLDETEAEEAELKVHLNETILDISEYYARGEDAPGQLLTSSLVLIPLATVFYGGFVFLIIWTRRLRRKYLRRRQHPKETGLNRLALQTLENLQYQAKVTSTQEAGFTAWKLAAKSLRGKELQRRPISLPGLTAECNSFLREVAESFGGKCIICFDELDKITDPEQLANLLKAVKGILGQERSYFLLTVSEDALARFSTRRRLQRDMLESSFDEILYLDRVSPTTASKIIEAMLAIDNEDRGPQLEPNAGLIWAFARGIPREIKRNAVLCATEGYDLSHQDPQAIWGLLFLDLLDSLRSWTLYLSSDTDASYRFLHALAKSREMVPSDSLSASSTKEWYARMLALWGKHYQLGFLDDETVFFPVRMDKQSADTPSADPEGSQFERGILELAIGAFALVTLCDDQEVNASSQMDELLEVFALLPYNKSYAGYKFHGLLKRAGIPSTLSANDDGSRPDQGPLTLDW